jgi:hypothetical protein
MNHSSELDALSVQRLHKALRALPNRQAPKQLTQQVLHTIEQQAHASWWNQAFRRWPRGAQTVLISACLIALSVSTVWSPWRFSLLSIRLHATDGVTRLTSLLTPLDTIISWQSVLLHALEKVPMHWLISFGSALGTLYLSIILLASLITQRFSHAHTIGRST